MTFVPAIKLGDEFSTSFLTNGSSYIAQQTIGHDDETGVIYSTFVALDVTVGGIWEIAFHIAEANPSNDRIITYWDGRETKSFIPMPEHRDMVRFVIRVSVEGILDRTKPSPVYMATHQAHLPRKALHKYELVKAVFKSRGYVVRDIEPYHGRLAWAMELPG